MVPRITTRFDSDLPKSRTLHYEYFRTIAEFTSVCSYIDGTPFHKRMSKLPPVQMVLSTKFGSAKASLPVVASLYGQ